MAEDSEKSATPFTTELARSGLISVEDEFAHTIIELRIRREVAEEYAKKAAKQAGKVGLPKLTKKSVKRFIAGVGAALLRGEIDTAKANVLLYAAQMLIVAERAEPTERKPRRLAKTNVIEGRM